MKRPEDIVDAQRETHLWLAQRVSAMVLALCIIVHLVTIVGAVQGGLSAAEIIDRVAGSGVWFAFYAVFVAAICLLYTSPSPRDQRGSRMPSSA